MLALACWIAEFVIANTAGAVSALAAFKRTKFPAEASNNRFPSESKAGACVTVGGRNEKICCIAEASEFSSSAKSRPLGGMFVRPGKLVALTLPLFVE